MEEFDIDEISNAKLLSACEKISLRPLQLMLKESLKHPIQTNHKDKSYGFSKSINCKKNTTDHNILLKLTLVSFPVICAHVVTNLVNYERD